jgi:hypothetical protein
MSIARQYRVVEHGTPPLLPPGWSGNIIVGPFGLGASRRNLVGVLPVSISGLKCPVSQPTFAETLTAVMVGIKAKLAVLAGAAQFTEKWRVRGPLTERGFNRRLPQNPLESSVPQAGSRRQAAFVGSTRNRKRA